MGASVGTVVMPRDLGPMEDAGRGRAALSEGASDGCQTLRALIFTLFVLIG